VRQKSPSDIISPPARLTNARKAWGEIEDRKKLTCPSANTTPDPPVWKENISSFAPQFIGVQGFWQVGVDTERW
jgi:hypothetical protein